MDQSQMFQLITKNNECKKVDVKRIKVAKKTKNFYPFSQQF
jgi:hypothetical protein